MLRMKFVGGLLSFIPTEFKFPGLSNECDIDVNVTWPDICYVAVWDSTSVWYGLRQNLKQQTFEGYEIKSCVLPCNSRPLVLMTNGQLFDAKKNKCVAEGIAYLSSASYYGHCTIGITFDGGNVIFDIARQVDAPTPITMGNCPYFRTSSEDVSDTD